MVKLFQKKRYTKNSCPEIVVTNIQNWFNGFQDFGRSKIIHQATVWQNYRNSQIYQINNNSKSPSCYQTFFTNNFLRTYADCILTTDSIVRNDPMAFHPGITKKLELPHSVYFNLDKKQDKFLGKPLGIITKNIQNNFQNSNKVFNDCLYKKHIISKPNIIERFIEYQENVKKQEFFQSLQTNNNIYFDSLDEIDLRQSINHLKQKYGYEQILIECGLNHTKQYYEKTFPWETDFEQKDTIKSEDLLNMIQNVDDLCPFDAIILYVYQSEDIDPSCVGPVFPSFQKLGEKFNVLKHTEPIQTEDGQFIMTVWRRKTKSELIRMCMARKEFGSDNVMLDIIRQDEMKKKRMDEQKNDKKRQPDGGKYDRFIEMTSGKYVDDHQGNQFASKSPHFNRKKYPYLSDREFQTKKPKD